MSTTILPAQHVQPPDLKEVGDLFRTHPDSALQIYPRYFSFPNDSIRGAAHNLMGSAFYYKSMYDSAISHFLRAVVLFEKVGDEWGYVKNTNSLGVCYFFLSNYEKAYEYHRKTMEIRERIKDPLISSTYNNIGLVLSELESKEEALVYYKKALSAKIEFKQFKSLSTTLTNIANIFQGKKLLDSAIYYELRNLQHLDSIPDERNLARCYNNLGLDYYHMKNYQKAEYYSRAALQMEKKLQQEFEIINTCHNLAYIYFDQGNLTLADKSLDSVFVLVKNTGEYRNVPDVYLLQSRIDSLRGNSKEAYYHLSQYVSIKNRFNTLERADLVLELEKKYQAELKEQKITDLEQRNTIKDLEATTAKQWQIGLIVFLVLVSGMAAVLFNRYQLKQKTAKTLDEKNKQLQNLNGFKDRMFAVISHDLRNPIYAFSTLMESLHQNVQHASKEELQEFLQSTLQSARDLQSLLNNLLEWALIQIGRLPFQPDKISLRQVVMESKQHIELMAAQKKVDIANAIQDEKAFADKGMLVIVMRNLLTNAIKFSAAGNTIQLAAERVNGSVRLSVQDQGLGIKPEDLEKLFKQEESTQGIGNSADKGAGIGLLLCKELVDRNQGRIWAESELGKGSTFYVEVPSA